MKKLLGIILLLVAIILGGYFSTGLITERTLKKNLNTLNQANGFSVELVGYHRGLFKSTADMTWHMQMPEKILKKEAGASIVVPPKRYSFDMPLVVYHGPIIFESNRIRLGLGAAQGDLSLPDAYASEFEEMFSSKSTKPALKISLFVTYLNKTHLEIGVPAFELFAKRGQQQFQWLGMRSDLRFSPESTRLKGHLTLDGLRMAGEKFRVILNQITSAYDVYKAKNGLFLGQAKLDLPVLQVFDKKQVEFELKQLQLKSKSEQQGDLFDSSFHAGFKTLISRDNTYGPGELDVSIKKLDANILAELNHRINQLQQVDTMSGQAQQLLLSLLPDIPKLLGKGAIFEIGVLKLALSEGTLDGSMRIAFPETTSDAPMQALQKIQGDAHLNIPRSFLKTLLVRSFKHELIQAHEEATHEASSKNAPDEELLGAPIQQAKNQANNKTNKKASVTLAELDQQAAHHADQKLADLIQMGVFQAKGANYVLELKLASGRLLVNGHPFHSGMLSF